LDAVQMLDQQVTTTRRVAQHAPHVLERGLLRPPALGGRAETGPSSAPPVPLALGHDAASSSRSSVHWIVARACAWRQVGRGRAPRPRPGPLFRRFPYPSASRHSPMLFARHVNDGVSRTVYMLASVWRSAMSRSRKRPTWSVSNATTNSWSSSPYE